MWWWLSRSHAASRSASSRTDDSRRCDSPSCGWPRTRRGSRDPAGNHRTSARTGPPTQAPTRSPPRPEGTCRRSRGSRAGHSGPSPSKPAGPFSRSGAHRGHRTQQRRMRPQHAVGTDKPQRPEHCSIRRGRCKRDTQLLGVLLGIEQQRNSDRAEIGDGLQVDDSSTRMIGHQADQLVRDRIDRGQVDLSGKRPPPTLRPGDACVTRRRLVCCPQPPSP